MLFSLPFALHTKREGKGKKSSYIKLSDKAPSSPTETVAVMCEMWKVKACPKGPKITISTKLMSK